MLTTTVAFVASEAFTTFVALMASVAGGRGSLAGFGCLDDLDAFKDGGGEIPFWAAAPKGTKSCRTQGEFVHPSVRPSVRPFVSPIYV